VREPTLEVKSGMGARATTAIAEVVAEQPMEQYLRPPTQGNESDSKTNICED